MTARISDLRPASSGTLSLLELLAAFDPRNVTYSGPWNDSKNASCGASARTVTLQSQQYNGTNNGFLGRALMLSARSWRKCCAH